MEPYREEIKAAVKEALREEIAPLYVDRETHYIHHQFIQSMIEWMDDAKGTVWGAFLKVAVYTLLLMLIGGFIWWGRGHFR
ncbi:MAG TPA: hypothetical protein VJM57_08945 [Thermodesulfobacteriota bacterium]|nr:hypothetical protein [Thermodesulfobacteriota bacterium]